MKSSGASAEGWEIVKGRDEVAVVRPFTLTKRLYDQLQGHSFATMTYGNYGSFPASVQSEIENERKTSAVQRQDPDGAGCRSAKQKQGAAKRWLVVLLSPPLAVLGEYEGRPAMSLASQV